jgi:TonB family protein
VSTGTTVRVVVRRGPKESPTTAETVIELSTGAVPGAEDCLGPGQSWDENGRTPTYVQVDELPEAITRVQPEYSKSMQARGLSGGLIVNALVCRSGRVLDASAQWGRDRTPIPELEAAAVAAAKQWVFKPGAVGGQPVATFVAIPFVFPPR